jgi:monoamine oxidase
MFVVYFDPVTAHSVGHSLGLQKGLIGVINAYSSSYQTEENNVVIAHELLHTAGASDKYDLVVIATPFSALRHIRMTGLISAEKRRAVRQLHYDNSCKIIIEFEQRFWARRQAGRPPIDGGRSIS